MDERDYIDGVDIDPEAEDVRDYPPVAPERARREDVVAPWRRDAYIRHLERELDA